MKIKTLSLTTILGIFGLILMIHSMSSYAGSSAISCSTPFGEKSFTIEDGLIGFKKIDESGVSRAISSVNGDSVRTQIKNKGFIKTLYINGNKHRIHVNNTSEFSDVNDYLSITSPKGHEMTYPLNCHSV